MSVAVAVTVSIASLRERETESEFAMSKGLLLGPRPRVATASGPRQDQSKTWNVLPDGRRAVRYIAAGGRAVTRSPVAAASRPSACRHRRVSIVSGSFRDGCHSSALNATTTRTYAGYPTVEKGTRSSGERRDSATCEPLDAAAAAVQNSTFSRTPLHGLPRENSDISGSQDTNDMNFVSLIYSQIVL